MTPLNIAITDLSLETVIGAGYHDAPVTLADAIVTAAVQHLAKDGEYREIHSGLAKRVAIIRDEEIREVVKTEIASVMTEPVQQTNQWGEPTGKPPTTLRALIVGEAEKFFTEKKSNNDYGRGPSLTGAERVIAALVEAELVKAMAAIFAEEKAKVVAAVQGKAAELLADAVKAGLRK